MADKHSHPRSLSSSGPPYHYHSQHNDFVQRHDDVLVNEEERRANSYLEPLSDFHYLDGVCGALDRVLLTGTHAHYIESTPAIPVLKQAGSPVKTAADSCYLALPGQQRQRSPSMASASSRTSSVSSHGSGCSRRSLNSIFDTGALLDLVSPLDTITKKYSAMIDHSKIDTDVDDTDSPILNSKRWRG